MVKPSSDPRFEKVFKDPRFKRISKKETKVKIDSRFQKMFTDERFHTKYTVDKRGKKVDELEKEDLHKFYDVEEDIGQEKKIDRNEKSIHEEKGKKNEKKIGKPGKKKKKLKASEKEIEDLEEQREELQEDITTDDDDENEESSDGEADFSDIRGEKYTDKDGAQLSSDEDELEEITIDESGITHGWGELDEDAKRLEDAETFRLAVCNCDWDRISASDLYVLFNSFKPTGGSIQSVKIYLSEFGRERLREEDISGPKELKETKLDSDEDSDNEGNLEGSGYNMEKLREYQLNRLKYYYAVVECNDIETADKLYEVCDGMEYEMSGTRLDLRFVPNDMIFDDEPTAVANESLNLKNYEPTTFLNTALQQSTVRLTWDESDPKRIQNTMRKFTKEDIENMDFKDYLASSSSEDEEETKQRRAKVKAYKKASQGKDTESQGDKQGFEMESTKDNEMVSNKDTEMENNKDTEMENNKDTEMENNKDTEMENEDYSGSSDDEFSDDEEERIRKYRLLMEEINAKEKKDEDDDDEEHINDDEKVKMGMDFTWNPGTNKSEEGEYKNSVNDDEDTNEFAGDDNVSVDGEVADGGFDDPFFQRAHEEGGGEGENIKNHNRKETSKKQKKKKKKKIDYMTEEEKAKKNELELLLIGEEEDKKHFSLKGILEQEKLKKSDKRKRRKRKENAGEEEDHFEFNTTDDRFNALYDSHLYSIDPSEPNFKKTKATEAIIKEAQKRREQRATRNHEKAQSSDVEGLKTKTGAVTGSTRSTNLSALVSSVKSNTLNHQMKKKKSKLK